MLPSFAREILNCMYLMAQILFIASTDPTHQTTDINCRQQLSTHVLRSYMSCSRYLRDVMAVFMKGKCGTCFKVTQRLARTEFMGGCRSQSPLCLNQGRQKRCSGTTPRSKPTCLISRKYSLLVIRNIYAKVHEKTSSNSWEVGNVPAFQLNTTDVPKSLSRWQESMEG